MCPELFHIGDFAVRAYGLALALSFLIGLSLIGREARILKLDPETFGSVTFSIIGQTTSTVRWTSSTRFNRGNSASPD
jgi:prolipoprotein diacylglyceryltransferase